MARQPAGVNRARRRRRAVRHGWLVEVRHHGGPRRTKRERRNGGIITHPPPNHAKKTPREREDAMPYCALPCPDWCLVRLGDSASHNSIFLSHQISHPAIQPAEQGMGIHPSSPAQGCSRHDIPVGGRERDVASTSRTKQGSSAFV